MNNIAFLKESIKNIKTVGTITRSSKFLCKGMVKHVDFENAKTIVELGAGDGVITKHILRHMREDAVLLAFEVNKKFCDKMRKIDDKRLVVIEDSAENLSKYVKEQNVEHVEFIVSAIPFVALPDELGLSIVNECHKYLKLGGSFIQVHYSLLAKKLYQKVFGNVDINFVPINIPPAFVLVSKKN